jgi:hypothetical protein
MGPRRRHRPARYFTLEKPPEVFFTLRAAGIVTEASDTVLGEWTPGGHHIHGPGPPPRWEAFATALVQRFAGNRESVGSPGRVEAPPESPP